MAFAPFHYGIMPGRAQAACAWRRRVSRRKKSRNSVSSTRPFKMLEMVMLHHTPFRPSAVADSTMAMGMRAEVSTMLVMDGGSVLPKPENAPPRAQAEEAPKAARKRYPRQKAPKNLSTDQFIERERERERKNTGAAEAED